MHKEIRRHDLLLGMNWAEVVKEISGETGLINYCFKIIFEESRAIGLYYDFLSKSKTGLQLARSLILSTKKWELYCLPRHIENWIHGYENYLAKPHITKEDFMSLSTPIQIYRIWFYFKEHKNDRERLKELLQSVCKGNEILSNFLSSSGKSGYEFMVALELSLGLLDFNEINQLKVNDDPIGVKFFIPRFENYILDVHCWEGKRLMKKHIDKFIKDDDLGETGLDLRYSGLISSSYKRELAFENGLKEWKWDQVKIVKAKMGGIMALERFFYPTLFSTKKS